MSQDSSQFVGSIPENYDRGLGPHIFEDYGREIARRAADRGAKRVLELAAGTGIVSRYLRDALPSEVELTVTDLNPPMLEVARNKFNGADRVEFQPADAMDLPFDDNSFDLIVCQFGVMFFPDRPAAFSEARRVLRPGGHYLFNVWGSMARNPFSRIAYDAGAQFFPDDPPGFYKVPFGYHDPAAVRRDMAAGGFQDLAHEVIEIDKAVADYELFATGMVFGNPLADEIGNRGGNAAHVQAAIRANLERQFGPTPSTMPLQAIFFEGRA